MREYRLRLDSSGITRERYNQLKWIAREYDALRRREQAFRRGETDRREGGNGAWRGISDPTAEGGMRLANSPYAWKIAAIEQSAAAADPALCEYVLQNVTRGRRYEELDAPCGRNQFFRARRRFFEELDRRMP